MGDSEKKADKRFRNSNEVAKEKRAKKNAASLKRAGLEGQVLSKKEEKRQRRRQRTMRENAVVERLKEGATIKDVAEEFDIATSTVSNIKRRRGLVIKAEDVPLPESQPTLEEEDAFAKKLSKEAKAALAAAKEEARGEEAAGIDQLSENHSSPQEQYQAYIAAQGMRLMRDGMKTIRPPRTVKEMMELDSMTRRAMGLSNTISPKVGGGGGGTLTIDVNILTNTKATKGGAGSTVDAEVID